MEFKEKLINLFNKEYKNWEDYTEAFESFSKELVSNKEDLTKKINSEDISEEEMFNVQKLFVKFNLASIDLNNKTSNLVYFYMTLTSLGLKEDLDKEVVGKMSKVLLSKRKETFVPYKGELKERLEGALDSKTKEVMESELYKKMTSKI